MNLTHIGIIARLELTQRLRSVGWYILLGVYALILLGVTGLSFAVYSFTGMAGAGVYSIVVNIVLLLVMLVSPTLSGNAINGDRDSATLAAVQVTAASTGDIMLGKLLAAVATGGVFLLVAVPFLAISLIGGGAHPATLAVSLLVLAAEIVIIAAIGVGFSGLVARPLFSVAATYLVVAALAVGTLIAFGLGGTALRTETTSYSRPYDSMGNVDCERWETYTYEEPRFDRVWWVLTANPFVVLADATPTVYTADGWPADMFGQIKYGVRISQLPPQESRWDECDPEQSQADQRTPEQIMSSTVPSWFIGLGIQIVIAGGLFAGAWARTGTPARMLPPGTRIA